jgi:hypothetical protein
MDGTKYKSVPYKLNNFKKHVSMFVLFEDKIHKRGYQIYI